MGLHKESWQEELCFFFRVQRGIFMTEISFLEHSLSKMKHINTPNKAMSSLVLFQRENTQIMVLCLNSQTFKK